MIGDDVISRFIDSIFASGANVVSYIANFFLSAVFYNWTIAFILFFILMNVIAVVLMKKDKEYAGTEGARRISERMLLSTAFFGGAFGEYYAMFKFKHKTLHKKFLYGVPLAMVFQFALLSYTIMYGILV